MYHLNRGKTCSKETNTLRASAEQLARRQFFHPFSTPNYSSANRPSIRERIFRDGNGCWTFTTLTVLNSRRTWLLRIWKAVDQHTGYSCSYISGILMSLSIGKLTLMIQPTSLWSESWSRRFSGIQQSFGQEVFFSFKYGHSSHWSKTGHPR